MKLAATKRMRYGGRSLQPGDPFEASTARDARILKAIGKAVDFVDPDLVEMVELRKRALAVGLDVDGRWGLGRLAQEVADAEGQRRFTYQRRDMVAEDSE